jgi:RNA polymerase sigma-70 factor (ECF subfamily)
VADRSLFDVLCVSLRPKLLAHAVRLCAGNLQRAEDIVQDSLIRAWKKWPEWQPSGDPASAASAWMYRIVTNAYMNEYASRQSQKRTLEAAEREFAIQATETPDEPVSTTFGPEIVAALAQLFPGFREVVELHYVQGKKCHEIAAELGIPVGSVLSRLSRARKQLEPLLAEHARKEHGFRLEDVALHRARKDAAVVDASLTEATLETEETDADGVDRVVTRDDRRELVSAQLA